MKNITKILIIAVMLILNFKLQTSNLFAQDFHVSQYDVLTMYYNPALTGVYKAEEKADYKISLTHRSQWASLGIKPFKTYSLGYDMKYNRFGLGALLINNNSGVGSFNTLNFLLSGSYSIIKDENSPHTVTTGLQMGLINKSVNPNSYLYESQLNSVTNTLDENLSNGEAFSNTSKLNFDANIGIFYSYHEKGKWYRPFIGFSIYHITQPNESITSEASSLPMRFNLNLGSELIVNEKVTLTPNFLYLYQAKATEFNIGSLGTYRIKDKNDIIYGIHYRWDDAIIINAGFRKDNITLRMSYDATTSSLSGYNSNRGAYELTLVITGKKGVNPLQNVTRFN